MVDMRNKAGRSVKHGMTLTLIYQIWAAMLQRCNNPNNKAYKNYGGRGITVSEEFHNFKIWYKHIGPCPGPEYSQDRRDNDGNYERGNIRWVTWKEQMNNRRPISCGPQKQKWLYGHGPNGEMIIENNQSHVARVFKLIQSCVSACLLNICNQHRGWTFQFIK